MIKIALRSDIPQLVALDRKAYSRYGADKDYFMKRFSAKNTKILKVENEDRVIGFTVFELLNKDEIPSDFVDLKIDEPIKDVWAHIIAFTTKTNYLNIESDSMLVKAIEKSARQMGSKIFCVPLSIDHPFIEHDVFGFWEKNGYKKVGTIDWLAGPNEKIKCYLYRKIV